MNPNCDGCGEEMEFSKRLSNGRTENGGKYRRIRYVCFTCDIFHTEYAQGKGDKERTIEALKEANQ